MRRGPGAASASEQSRRIPCGVGGEPRLVRKKRKAQQDESAAHFGAATARQADQEGARALRNHRERPKGPQAEGGRLMPKQAASDRPVKHCITLYPLGWRVMRCTCKEWV